MLSTSTIVINIRIQIGSRWVTKFGYICIKSVSLGPTISFVYYDMGLTPSLSLCETILLNSSFPHFLTYT